MTKLQQLAAWLSAQTIDSQLRQASPPSTTPNHQVVYLRLFPWEQLVIYNLPLKAP